MYRTRKSSYSLLLLLFLLLPFGHVYAEGFLAGTLVKTPQGYTAIEELQVGEKVLCYNFQGDYVESPITTVAQKKVSHCVEIFVDNECIRAACDQRFYLSQEKSWINAQDITLNQLLLRDRTQSLFIDDVHYVHQDAHVYMIAVEGYHNFCVSSLDVHVHNFFPAIALGLSWVFGGGLVFSGATVTTAVAGVGIGLAMARKHRNNKAEMRLEPTIGIAAGGGSPKKPDDEDDNNNGNNNNFKLDDDRPDKVNSMKEVFDKTEFGTKLKKNSRKTKLVDAKTDSQIYEVTTKIREYGLKTGDKLYLDGYHNDHIEVFRKGKCIDVLGFDGTSIESKKIKACGRRLLVK